MGLHHRRWIRSLATRKRVRRPARAPGPGLMLPDSKMVKQRATSSTSRDQERQASSAKLQVSWSMHALTNRIHRLQATSFKLDMKDIMGYINLMIGLLIGQCAQAWNLQSSPPLKSRGVGGNSGLQAKPFFIYPKIQASSGKHQAPSTKVQAPSHKRQAPGPWTLEKVLRYSDQGPLPR